MNKKIVLITLYSFGSTGIRNIYYQLLSKGYDVYCIYFGEFLGIAGTKPPSKKDYDILINLLRKINPKIIGISSFTGTFDISIKIIKKIKQVINSLILFGGTHAIIEPEECIKYADVVCVWEGDESVPKLCDRFFQGEDYSNIPNLWVKQKNNIIKNRIKSVEDLNSLALPNLQSKNFFYIDKGNLIEGEWKLPSAETGYQIMASRGCPNRCSFCINDLFLKRLGSTSCKYIRRRSVEHIIEELKIAKKHFGNKLKIIRFYDDILGIDEKWIEKFVEQYIKEIGIPFWCQMHFSFATEKILLLLKKAGVQKISFGLESACEKFRKEVYNKYIPNKKVYEAVRFMNKHKVPFTLNLIINNPLETDAHLRGGVRFLLSLRPVKLTWFSLVNYPKTELTERLKREGLIKKAHYSLFNYLEYRVTKNQPFKLQRNEYWFYILNFVPKSYIPKPLMLLLIKDIFVKNHWMLLWIFKLGNKTYQIKEKLVQTFSKL